MKLNRKVTVNDVALKGGVSMSLAAAVLRNAKCNIGCTEATRERILKVAKELNYRPNKLARAMKTGIVPLVALCIHHDKFNYEINLYLHDLLPGVAFALKPKGFNAVFVPYDPIEDFMEQTQTLADSNLISGIITNFPPEHEDELVGHLKKIGLPYVVFGKIKDSSVPCVSLDVTEVYKKLYEYGQTNGFRQTIWILARKNISGGIDWDPDSIILTPSPVKCRMEDFDLKDPNTLYVAANGEFTRKALIHDKGINEKNIISIEDKRTLIQFKPTVLVRSLQDARAEQATELFMKWITHGRIPESCKRQVKILPDDIEFMV